MGDAHRRRLGRPSRRPGAAAPQGGCVTVATVVNPYEALELTGSQPFPDMAAALVAFDAHVRGLGRELTREEYLAAWTMYVRGRFDQEEATRDERRAAIDR